MSGLQTEHLGKFFRDQSENIRALEDLCLEISGGSFTAITGPSGSGKTTLLTLLGAMDRPSRGRVLFNGQDLSACSDVELARVRRRMGFVFQNFRLIPRLPVWENISYPLVPRGVGRRERLQRALSLLSRLGLPAKIRAYPEGLSGGEQQRVALARALIGDPEVLFLDEPTSNLDDNVTRDLLLLLQEIQDQGKTVVTCSHDPRIIARAGKVYELEGGRLKRDP